MPDYTIVTEFDIEGIVNNPDGEWYDAPDLRFWYDQGVLNGATHLIIMHDFDDDPPDPYYVMPDQCWQDVQGRLEGGGNCWRVIELTGPLSDKDLDDFGKIIK